MKSPIAYLNLAFCAASLLFVATTFSGCRGSHESPPTPAPTRKAPPPAKAASAPALPQDAPRLAIVIDDLGRDHESADRLLAIQAPLTFAVIPNLQLSREVAAQAHQQGREVILHIPMAANGVRQPAPAEPVELHIGMSAGEVEQTVTAMLASVPYAIGANNHQGSSATQDRALMQAVMRLLKARNLFFLDSRTSAASVAYEVAQDAGMRAAYRTEFLDDTPEAQIILRQLQLAERRAREQGWAIAIGHPHPATLEVLERQIPQLHARGIRLVFVSQIAK